MGTRERRRLSRISSSVVRGDNSAASAVTAASTVFVESAQAETELYFPLRPTLNDVPSEEQDYVSDDGFVALPPNDVRNGEERREGYGGQGLSALQLVLLLWRPMLDRGTGTSRRDVAAVAANVHATTVAAANHVVDTAAAFRTAHAVVVSPTWNGNGSSVLLLFR